MKRDVAYIPDGRGSMLLVKGADDVMAELCQRDVGEASTIDLCGVPVRDVREETVFDINEFASAGLRTLMLAMRYLDEVETSEYLGALNEARHSITNRADRFARVAEKFETGLIVLGATAVEDKIQYGVESTVFRLLNAGVKVWMLTGDRFETSLNIARAVELLPRDGIVSDLCLHAETKFNKGEADAFVLEKRKTFDEDYLQWMANGKMNSLCVVLDGSAISCFASSRDNLKILANVLMSTVSVVACRCSPSQKALIVQLLKKADDRITLAIGDGANDVPMLEVANIGIGIIGSEGMQAVRASDYAIATFSHLGQLMLIHGRDCYNRISLVILYSFFKNIFLVLPNVFFALSNAFTGTSLYDSWILMSYNVFWTSLPIIVIGAMDITLPRWVVARYPIVYVEGRESISFNARKFIAWILRAIVCAVVVYAPVAVGMSYPSGSGGEVMGYAYMGNLVYYSVVVVANFILEQVMWRRCYGKGQSSVGCYSSL
ncbi:Phospholipid-transporting ATPase, putative [Perkinsus marinus ATCC 50983]|uniref:Phospholipid-transporting ATPase, putative n=1 Tax=Perkinsus marinus (strain ATCC 50983 / TXsc) TaxID=423536 RepID=C5KPJ0_PERM5|nr:Phospholipid-transporting ATPase, putative [Perkinsus marinus ATCC 50983]EER13619.1 Phospholipid-transporting ATPase, putative [Perkinsus marinus ATCC 50983]|eukprot:XP_002781824.1 Phospholipid-transporting ATPase, putative [Perkinsus marinus ATCC 50983]